MPRINIGAGGKVYEGWQGTEQGELDLLLPGTFARMFGEPDTVDAFLCEAVWEHLPAEDAQRAAFQCYRYLKPGGYLRVAVPDGFHPDPAYIDWVRPGGNGAGAGDHKVLYNWQTFARVFWEVGFRVEMLEWFDKWGTFHFREWDIANGMIERSAKNDPRNRDGVLRYTSIILDAWKE
jgi:predicted SAM-dependent methyltransferase